MALTRSPMFVTYVVTLLLAVYSSFACGGSSSTDATTPNPGASATSQPSSATSSGNEDALAAAMLMTREDLPGDYLEKKKTTDELATLAELCGRSEPPGATGRATTDDFLFDGQSPAFSEVVVVFATEADAQASLEAAPAFVDCALGAINKGKLNNATANLSGAISADVLIETGADTSRAVQITATKEYLGQTARATAQYTIVFANEGRVVYEVSTRGTGYEPMDLEEVAEVAQSAAARIRQQ